MQNHEKIEAMKAEIRQNEARIEQLQHQVQRRTNRIQHMESGERRARNHRLITRGAAMESVFPDIKPLTEREFYEMVERISEFPGIMSLINDALAQHDMTVPPEDT